jgi:hypothetical protein
MKLAALAIASAFALGIACDLIPEITHSGSSHGFPTFLLCGAAISLLIGIGFARGWRPCCAGNARLGRGLHRGTTEASESYFEFGELCGVDFEGVFVPASGGLRLGYIAPIGRRAPVAHAGNSISVLTLANCRRCLETKERLTGLLTWRRIGRL